MYRTKEELIAFAPVRTDSNFLKLSWWYDEEEDDDQLKGV